MTKKPKQQTADKKEEKKRGQPSFEFNQEYADIICELISSHSISVGKICRNMKEQDPGFPGKTTVFKWLANNEDFANQYTRAKKAQAEMLVDEIIDIADERAFDTTENNEGHLIPDHEYMQRSRLRIDTRKWLACKLIPKVYGDKITAAHTGGDEDSPPIKLQASVININDRIQQIKAGKK